MDTRISARDNLKIKKKKREKRTTQSLRKLSQTKKIWGKERKERETRLK